MNSHRLHPTDEPRARATLLSTRVPGARALAALSVLLAAGCASAGAHSAYDSPEAATEALVAALRTFDTPRVAAVLGDEEGDLLASGDEVADRADVQAFLDSYDVRHSLLTQGDESVLLVGADDWPLPIPLVRADSLWRFDVERGRDEVLSRRIGRNELATIEVCRAIVDAQREYAALDDPRHGAGAYAAHFVSSAGKHDGLYWEAAAGEPESPLGPLVADAASEGYAARTASDPARRPYHGYTYRILGAQGPAAPGGAANYWVDGRMTGGFALLAEPASYGNSGVMTFLVGPSGVLYQRDLGPETGQLAAKIERFDPDMNWSVVR